ncbi:MAG: hypothetical protein HWN66_00765 [Candidatus Helarchaeota archaeon]|nr:hypothetical protein [Candidatus Helarchaeota archaeon]
MSDGKFDKESLDKLREELARGRDERRKLLKAYKKTGKTLRQNIKNSSTYIIGYLIFVRIFSLFGLFIKTLQSLQAFLIILEIVSWIALIVVLGLVQSEG